MRNYIAVDSDNKWLAYGEYETPKECLEQAKECDSYDGGTISVFELKTLKPALEAQ